MSIFGFDMTGTIFLYPTTCTSDRVPDIPGLRLLKDLPLRKCDKKINLASTLERPGGLLSVSVRNRPNTRVLPFNAVVISRVADC